MKKFLRTTLKSISDEILKGQVKHNSKNNLSNRQEAVHKIKCSNYQAIYLCEMDSVALRLSK